MNMNCYLSEKEGLEAALKQMRHCTAYARAMVDMSQFGEEQLLQCFKADFDSPIHKEFEKILTAATVRTVMEKNYIPQGIKQEFAKKAAREQVEIYREAVITYKEVAEELSSREAQERRRENPFVDRIARLDTSVKYGIPRLARAGVSLGIGALIGVFATTTPIIIPTIVSYGLISLIPKEVKEKVAEKVNDIMERTVRIARTFADFLAERSVKIANNVKQKFEVLKGTMETIKNTITTAIKTIRNRC